MAEKNVRVKPKSSMSFNKKQWTGAIDTNDVGKRKLFVCNIDYTVQENLLAKHFAAFGQISKCKIMRDATNKSKVLDQTTNYFSLTIIKQNSLISFFASKGFRFCRVCARRRRTKSNARAGRFAYTQQASYASSGISTQ